MKLFFCLLLFSAGLLANDIVVTVHGYARTHKSMHKMGRALQKNGYNLYHFDYLSRSQSIEESTEDFVTFLREISKQHPDSQINFVTHSLGGILLRAAVNDPNCPKIAKQGSAILLGPPNRGSRLAKRIALILKLMGRGAGNDLAKNRDFSYLGDFPESMKVTIIAGTFGCNPLIPFPNDGKVALSETLLDTPHKFFEVSACHSMMMSNSKVITTILEELNAQNYSRNTAILGNPSSG
ncbi:MAG: alpha/beta hydrolase [Candidatus Algichlamydia australiensis]|nr:alpha/beta hydrolase [Chlamydiales bacterium]